MNSEASFGGAGMPSPPRGTMNSVKLLHIECCFFQFFNSPVALNNLKKNLASQEKFEMTPLNELTFSLSKRG